MGMEQIIDYISKLLPIGLLVWNMAVVHQQVKYLTKEVETLKEKDKEVATKLEEAQAERANTNMILARLEEKINMLLKERNNK